MAQGWKKQFLANEPRLSEAVEEYRGLGFEVHLETVDPQACAASQGCSSCFEATEEAEQFRVIFTRPGQKTRDQDSP